jgi:hypothetical protein
MEEAEWGRWSGRPQRGGGQGRALRQAGQRADMGPPPGGVRGQVD